MHPAILNTLSKKPIIPPNLKQNVLAWWDARERGQVWYGLNQAQDNGNFVNTTGWSKSGGTLAANNNILSHTANAATAAPYACNASTSTHETGIKYYGKATFRVTNASCSNIRMRMFGGIFDANVTPTENTWYTRSGVGIGTGVAAFPFAFTATYADAATANGKVTEVQNVILINLTAIFGAGNEPTAAEMDAILTADGNQYWEGTRQVLCNPDYKYYWRDYSGNGRHMKLNNFAYSGVDGWQQPYGLQGEGTDSWIGRAENGLIPENHSFSEVCFVSRLSGSLILLGYGFKTDFTTDPAFEPRYSGTAWACQTIDLVSGAVDASFTQSIVNNKIYCVIFTYNHADKKTKIYINGSLVATSDAITNGNRAINYYRSMRNEAGTTYSVNKEYVEALFNKALSPAEVKQLYDNNKGRFRI